MQYIRTIQIPNGETYTLDGTDGKITNCIVSSPSSAITISEQIITLHQGLTFLIPKSRNEDNTLNNIRYQILNDTTIDYSTVGERTFKFTFLYGPSGWYISQNYQESNNAPDFYGFAQCYFNYIDNLIYSNYNSERWEQKDIAVLGSGMIENGIITSFTPNLPVELLKRSDLNEIGKVYPVGEPFISLNNYLNVNEIWLEGAEVSRTTYSELFAIYGTTYGAGDGETTFNLPDFRNRVIWGAEDFGYIEAGLPNITGGFVNTPFAEFSGSGAFSSTNGGGKNPSPSNYSGRNANFDASRSNPIYGNSTTVQPPSIKVRVKTRYK